MRGREVILLNDDWLFWSEDNPAVARGGKVVRSGEAVTLPHTNALMPANMFSERRWQRVTWYGRVLKTPSDPARRRVILEFDGVMMTADVHVNGRHVAAHRGGYVGFRVDVTDSLIRRADAANWVAVRVDSRLHPDIPPCGRVMDYQTFGGIYREVREYILPECHIEDLFVMTPDPLRPAKTVVAAVTVRNTGPSEWTGSLRLELLAGRRRRLAAGSDMACHVPPGSSADFRLTLENLQDIQLWEPDDPALYRARVVMRDGSGVGDALETLFGFREARFTKEGPFVLNGRPLKLIGLNRHQTFPYIGAAAPARLQRCDADILKYKLGCNVVRTSHYPQSPHFLNRCDEIGLLVFEEIPGWGHIGDEVWKDLACRDVEAMIRRDRNHPSIILWGVRINESADDHDFYARTNALARRLDPTRPTGGVRWGVKSEFLEDVFTSNDYAYNPPKTIINEPPVTPYLVTEFGPPVDARRTAPMEIQVRWALEHAEILNAIMGHPRIAGGIGWCAFDYASQDSLTVDGVQPWGAYDMFRIPKLGAAVYASQMDPAVQPVLQAATRWKVGDQAGFDPNEQVMKTGHDAPLVVFTNCDRVDVYIGDEHRGTFTPARDRFPHLPHPPVFCTGLGTLWGPSWKSLKLVGWLGDRMVAEQIFPATHDALALEVTVDDRSLRADGSDMTRVAIRHTDGFGNVQNLSRVAVLLELDGPATLIGPNPCALAGGVAAVCLRAGRRSGRVTLRVSAPELQQERTVSVMCR